MWLLLATNLDLECVRRKSNMILLGLVHMRALVHSLQLLNSLKAKGDPTKPKTLQALVPTTQYSNPQALNSPSKAATSNLKDSLCRAPANTNQTNMDGIDPPVTPFQKQLVGLLDLKI